jgi:hypothetical protein
LEHREVQLKLTAFVHLALVVNARRSDRLKVEYSRTLSTKRILGGCLQALRENIDWVRGVRSELEKRIDVLGKVRKRQPFVQWAEWVVESRLEEAASWFQHQVHPRKVKQSCLKAMLSHKAQSSQLT